MRLAFLLSFCIFRVSEANVRADVSNEGSVDSRESMEEEREDSDVESVDVVACRDKNVG